MNRTIPVIACFAAASFLANTFGAPPSIDTEYLYSYSEVDIDPTSGSITAWSYAEIEGTGDPDSVYIEIEATLYMGGSQMDYSYTNDYGYAEVDLDDTVDLLGTSYRIYSDSDSYDDDLNLYCNADSNAESFAPAPTGETVDSTSNFSGDYVGTNFYLNLVPYTTFFDGGTVWEVISDFDDGCYGYWGTGQYLTPPAALSGTVGANGSYSDEISANAVWVNYYLNLVSVGQIPGGCGWGFNQVMWYSPPWGTTSLSYANNSNGQNIVYGHASAALQTCRAGYCVNN